MKNKEIAQLFNNMGTLLEIKGEIIFKVRAYYKAAEILDGLSEDIEDLSQDGRLDSLSGIGATLQEKIKEYLSTGKIKAYESLIKEIPETLLEVTSVPTVGPKKAKMFYEKLKVKSLADLKAAVDSGKLEGLPGIKEKSVENIKKGLRIIDEGQKRMSLAFAWDLADAMIAPLMVLPQVKKIEFAGSLRRGKDTVGDIDILALADEPRKVMDVFVSLPQVKNVNAHGETKSSVLTHRNIQADLRIVDEKSYGAALLYFTGSKDFNVRLRQLAQTQDKKVNEYGVYSVKGDKERYIAGKTEEDCFKALGLSYIPPELREEQAQGDIFKDKIPSLIEEKDIKGELHTHSTYSDGRHTVLEMAKAAQARGYKYLALTDHSAKLKIAGGLSVEDLKRKRKEIDGLNSRMKDFRILTGSEVEIDSDGNLDYTERILKELDVVVASIHTGFEQSSEKLTNRIISAIKSGCVNIIAHPMGVHIGKREPYKVDFKEICKAAADHNVALEINAFPIRLDLDSSNAYFAKKMGVTFTVNTDSHSIEHMEYMKYGIKIARRAHLEAKDVINTYTLERLLKFLKK